MKSNVQPLLFALAIFVVAAPSLQAAVLLGVQEGNPNMVFVDSITGSISPAFPVPGGIVPTRLVGLTRAENGSTVLFVREDSESTSTLFRLDPHIGTVLSAHALTTSTGQPDGLSYDSAGSSIFVVDDGQFIGRQVGFGGAYDAFVDPRPGIGLVGRDIEFPGALGGDDYGRHFGVFWPGLGGVGTRSATISEFDPADGTILNSFPVPPLTLTASGLAYDGQAVYFSSLELIQTSETDHGSRRLFTIDPDTGDVTNSVSYSGEPLVALAAAAPIDPIPEASSAVVWSVLCALALSSLSVKRRSVGENSRHNTAS